MSNINSLLDQDLALITELPKRNLLDYFNLTHKGLSYSRSLTLHECPRKYELTTKFQIAGSENSVTFAYGHSVGEGVQNTIAGESHARSITKAILAYDFDEDDLGSDSEKAAKKSIWQAILSIDLFHKQYNAGVYDYLDGWVVPEFTTTDSEGNEVTRKACELSFVIDCFDGYSYEGHIDLVLYHPLKKRYMVVELKTTGSNSISEASYKNSSQALGYGVVLDAIADSIKATASYDVLYLVYKSRSNELVPMVFNKTPLMRAQWLNSLASDIQSIESYEEASYYPHRGESCFNYFRPCKFFGKDCESTNEFLTKAYGKIESTEDAVGKTFTKMESPDFKFSIEELVERQVTLLSLGNTSVVDVDLLLDVTNR